MADVHGNPNTRGPKVGTVAPTKGRDNVLITVKVGPFEIPMGPRYFDAHELQTHENETARKGGK